MGLFSLLPPLLAIFLAIRTKQVYLSLLAGIFVGQLALVNWNIFQGFFQTLNSFINILSDKGNSQVIIFCMLVGGLISLAGSSGGVQGFIDFMTHKNIVTNKKGAMLLSWIIGLLLFIETSLICLVVGSIGRPLFDRFKISRAKLAYIADSTAAPVCVMVPFNGWGAYITVLIAKQGLEHPFNIMLKAITTNFYAIFTIIFVFFIIMSGKDFFTMKKEEEKCKIECDNQNPSLDSEYQYMLPKENIPHRARNFIIPIIVLIVMLPIGMLITGHGEFSKGSGTTSVYWGVFIAITVAIIMYKFQKILPIKESINIVITGAGNLLSMGVLMILAFSLGLTCKQLGTGLYVAHIVQNFHLPQIFIVPLIFVASSFIAFSTGTSWGTFAIMIPIAIPIATYINLPVPFTISAVMGGGVFGDHCSPISDTTIISSLASGCDHIKHVETQLPYALIVGGITFGIYFIASVLFL